MVAHIFGQVGLLGSTPRLPAFSVKRRKGLGIWHVTASLRDVPCVTEGAVRGQGLTRT